MELDPRRIINNTVANLGQARRAGKELLDVFFSPERAATNAREAKELIMEGEVFMIDRGKASPEEAKHIAEDVARKFPIESVATPARLPGVVDIHTEPVVISTNNQQVDEKPVDIDLTIEEAESDPYKV